MRPAILYNLRENSGATIKKIDEVTVILDLIAPYW